MYFVCETSDPEVLARTGKSVGFDFGLKMFLNASDGNDIASPLFLGKMPMLLKAPAEIFLVKLKVPIIVKERS